MGRKSLEQKLIDHDVNSKWIRFNESVSSKAISLLGENSSEIDELFSIYSTLYKNLKMDSPDFSVNKTSQIYANLMHIYLAYHLLSGYIDRLTVLEGKSLAADTPATCRFELRKGMNFGLVNHAMDSFRNKKDIISKDLKYIRDYAYSLGYHNKSMSAIGVMHEVTPKLIPSR